LTGHVTKATRPLFLYSRDAFVLQNTHNYATILRLSCFCLAVADLVGLSHRTWG
jgi:hypothetical protein